MNKCVIDIHFHGINIIVDVLLFHIYYASLVLMLHLNIIIYHFFYITFFIITNSKINRFEILWCFGKHSKTLRNFFFIEFGSFLWAYFHFILLAMHQLTFNLKKNPSSIRCSILDMKTNKKYWRKRQRRQQNTLHFMTLYLHYNRPKFLKILSN